MITAELATVGEEGVVEVAGGREGTVVWGISGFLMLSNGIYLYKRRSSSSSGEKMYTAGERLRWSGDCRSNRK